MAGEEERSCVSRAIVWVAYHHRTVPEPRPRRPPDSLGTYSDSSSMVRSTARAAATLTAEKWQRGDLNFRSRVSGHICYFTPRVTHERYGGLNVTRNNSSFLIIYAPRMHKHHTPLSQRKIIISETYPLIPVCSTGKSVQNLHSWELPEWQY